MKPKSKLIGECTAFWNAAYKLVNEDRIMPADERGISEAIDDAIELRITDEWAMLCRRENGYMVCKMRMGQNREDFLPFISLLQWYLKWKMR